MSEKKGIELLDNTLIFIGAISLLGIISNFISPYIYILLFQNMQPSKVPIYYTFKNGILLIMLVIFYWWHGNAKQNNN
mgnify:CR=1 FL=1